jgi:hypothetical protein
MRPCLAALPLRRALLRERPRSLAGVIGGEHRLEDRLLRVQVLRGYKSADGLWPSEYIPARKAVAAAELLGKDNKI